MQELDFNDAAVDLIEMLEAVDSYDEIDQDFVEGLVTTTIKILVELRLSQNNKLDVFGAIALAQQQLLTTIDHVIIIEKTDPQYPDFH